MSKLLLPFFIILFSFGACGLTLNTTISDVVVSDVSINKSPIVQTQETKFIKDGEPFYFVGVNSPFIIQFWLNDQADGTTGVEDYFDQWQADGVKVVRIIMYVLDDVVLDDPTLAPTTAVVGGISCLDNGKTYVYRYTACNYSKTVYDYVLAETLPSPIATAVITVTNQKVNITIPAVDNAYIYRIYRRESTDAVDSETLVGKIYVQVGHDEFTFQDRGEDIVDGEDTEGDAIPGSNSTTNYPRCDGLADGRPFLAGVPNHGGSYHEAKFVALDNILDLARRHDVMIMPVLIDFQNNLTGGFKDFLHFAGNATADRDNFWRDCVIEEWFKDWLTTLMNRVNTVNNRHYKNDPSIFAWDLINEPWIATGGRYRPWIRKMVEHIKTVDPNHMISMGDDGSIYWKGSKYVADAYNVGLAHSYLGCNVVEGLDFIQWHTYPETPDFTFDSLGLDNTSPVTGVLTIDEFKSEMQKRADLCFHDKPIVFGEFGMADWTDADDWIPEVQQAILDITPNYQLGDNLLLNPDFSDGLSDWTFHADCSIDTETTFEQKQTLNCKDIGGDAISQIITVQSGIDYWFRMIFKKPDTIGAIRFNVEGRVAPVDAWTRISNARILEGTSYWQNEDPVEHGYYKLSSGSYTQFRIRVLCEVQVDDFWIAKVELRPYENKGGDTVFGGTMWWAWGSDNFDKDNATVRQQLRDAATLYD